MRNWPIRSRAKQNTETPEYKKRWAIIRETQRKPDRRAAPNI